MCTTKPDVETKIDLLIAALDRLSAALEAPIKRLDPVESSSALKRPVI